MSKFVLTAEMAAKEVITQKYFNEFFVEPFKKVSNRNLPEEKRAMVYNCTTGEKRSATLVDVLRYGQVLDANKNGVKIYTEDDFNIPEGKYRAQKAAAALVQKGIKPWLITKGEWSEYYTPIAKIYQQIAELEKDATIDNREEIKELKEEQNGLNCLRFPKFKEFALKYYGKLYTGDLGNEKELAKACLKLRAKDFMEFIENNPHEEIDMDNLLKPIEDEDNLKLSSYENAMRSKEAEDKAAEYADKSDIEVGFDMFAAAVRSVLMNNVSVFGCERLPEHHGFNGVEWGAILRSGYKTNDDEEGKIYAQVPIWDSATNEIIGHKDLTQFFIFIKTSNCRNLMGDRNWLGAIGATTEEFEQFQNWIQKQAEKKLELERQAKLAAKWARMQEKEAQNTPVLPDEDIDLPF